MGAMLSYLGAYYKPTTMCPERNRVEIVDHLAVDDVSGVVLLWLIDVVGISG